MMYYVCTPYLYVCVDYDVYNLPLPSLLTHRFTHTGTYVHRTMYYVLCTCVYQPLLFLLLAGTKKSLELALELELPSLSLSLYIYIYIYIERERERLPVYNI